MDKNECCHVTKTHYDLMWRGWGSVRIWNLPKWWKVQLYAAAPTHARPFQQGILNPHLQEWTPCVYPQNIADTDRCLSLLGTENKSDVNTMSLYYSLEHPDFNPFKLSAKVWDEVHEPERQFEFPGITHPQDYMPRYQPPITSLDRRGSASTSSRGGPECRPAFENPTLITLYAPDPQSRGVVAKFFDNAKDYEKFNSEPTSPNVGNVLALPPSLYHTECMAKRADG